MRTCLVTRKYSDGNATIIQVHFSNIFLVKNYIGDNTLNKPFFSCQLNFKYDFLLVIISFTPECIILPVLPHQKIFFTLIGPVAVRLGRWPIVLEVESLSLAAGFQYEIFSWVFSPPLANSGNPRTYLTRIMCVDFVALAVKFFCSLCSFDMPESLRTRWANRWNQ